MKTLATGAALGFFGPKLLDGGGNNNDNGEQKKNDVWVIDKDGNATKAGSKKDDGNTSVSTQTGADQRPKSPLDTNPYFDNPGLKSYWDTRAKQVRQRAMDGSRKNLKNHVEKKDDEIVIIEHLLNNGHADTVEEAVYVFTQLDEDYIASILNENV